jgi:hypothetical protein
MYQQSFVVQLFCVFLFLFFFVGYIHSVVLANRNLILVSSSRGQHVGRVLVVRLFDGLRVVG